MSNDNSNFPDPNSGMKESGGELKQTQTLSQNLPFGFNPRVPPPPLYQDVWNLNCVSLLSDSDQAIAPIPIRDHGQAPASEAVVIQDTYSQQPAQTASNPNFLLPGINPLPGIEIFSRKDRPLPESESPTQSIAVILFPESGFLWYRNAQKPRQEVSGFGSSSVSSRQSHEEPHGNSPNFNKEHIPAVKTLNKGYLLKMAMSIRIIMADKVKNVSVAGNYIYESTIRHAFQLKPDSVVELSFKSNEMDINCLTNETGTTFILPENWPHVEFTARSDSVTSRPPTPPTMQNRPPTPFETGKENKISKIRMEWENRIFRVSGEKMIGSGVLIDNRHVLTASHLAFKLNGRYYIKSGETQEIPVTCKFISRSHDFALLQSDALPMLPVSIGTLVPGSKYYMLGFPMGLNPTNPAITKGTIEGYMDDCVHMVGTPGSRRGYSGSPVFNDSGRIAGLLLGATTGVTVETTLREILDSASEQKYARILAIGYIMHRYNQGNSDNES